MFHKKQDRLNKKKIDYDNSKGQKSSTYFCIPTSALEDS